MNGFTKFIEDSDKEIQAVVNKYKTINANQRKKELWPHYLQYKMLNTTYNLVYATWFLAIATIILALVTKFV